LNDLTSVIAIDGPAASGKTTIGRLLAERLDYLLLDTGSMYRAVTLAALRQGVDVEDETAVTHLAQSLTIDIKPAAGEKDGRLSTTLLDGEDVTWALRGPDVDAHVSQVSSYAPVRREMVNSSSSLAGAAAWSWSAGTLAPSSCPTPRSSFTSPPVPRNAPTAAGKTAKAGP
jgi:CMP/dCMP kinase